MYAAVNTKSNATQKLDFLRSRQTKKAVSETHSPLKNHEFHFVPSTHGFVLCQVRHFLPCQPMDRLPKKKALQESKKNKVKKPRLHLWNP